MEGDHDGDGDGSGVWRPTGTVVEDGDTIVDDYQRRHYCGSGLSSMRDFIFLMSTSTLESPALAPLGKGCQTKILIL